MNPGAEQEDHGKVVGHPGFRYVWAWIFPAIAAAAAVWLFWSNWKTRGPEIEIAFEDAPGIRAGKTALIFRGVESGTVTGVKLEPGLGKVIVRVRLQAFAADLAREGTAFWVERPELTLRGAVGIEALIQGNWIQAREGHGPASYSFEGLPQEPLTPFEDPSLSIELSTVEAPFLDRGTPVYFHGTRIGYVRQKSIDAGGRTKLSVIVDTEFSDRVTSASRFWVLPAAGLQVSGRGADLQIAGIEALLNGGIAFDQFGEGSSPAKDGDRFDLYSNETLARAQSPAFKIRFSETGGIVPGITRVTLLGDTAGIVEAVEVDPVTETAAVTARLFREYGGLLKSGTSFSLVRPQISLQGVSGLDALVGGPFLAMRPGGGENVSVFEGEIPGGPHPWNVAASGLAITLRSRVPGAGIMVGSPIFFHGINVGKITSTGLAEDGGARFGANIDPAFAAALGESSRFWLIPPLSASVGPGVLDLKMAGLAALIGGAVAFDSFGEIAAPAKAGAEFEIFSGEALAAATSSPFKITFTEGRGLVPGRSELRYLGLPAGVVESAVPRRGGIVEVTARLRPGFSFLRAAGSQFVIIKPQISLQGFSGVETLISGVYIDCVPGGGGGVRDSFQGTDSPSPKTAESDTFKIVLIAKNTGVAEGAPILFRDYAIGAVLTKELETDGSSIRLNVGVEPRYRSLVRSNSKFRDASGTQARIGPFKIGLPNESLLDPSGRIILTNPEGAAGKEVRAGQVFELEGKR